LSLNILEKIRMYHNICLYSLFFILISLSLSCTRAHLSIDKEIDTANIHTIQQNTPYADVLAALGPPAKLTALPAGFAFLYESTQVFLRGLSVFIIHPAFKIGVTKEKRILDAYVVVFNEQGLVVGAEHITKTVPLSLALAVSLTTRGKGRELTVLAPQHRWGMSMLLPLPKTLNAASDIDAGLYGLEQRGTPIAVGQRTLEGTYGKSRR
jgi:hypothetical protein